MKKLMLALFIFSISTAGLAAPKKRAVKKAKPATTQSKQVQNVSNEFETLGDNRVFTERVKNMDTKQKVRIVQNRIVDLNNRLEVGGHYAINGGGDSYVTTQNLGAHIDFHFNPRWAIGFRYQHSYNELTSEGKAQYDVALAAAPGSLQTTVGIDHPVDTYLGTISYAPIYGKLNLFDWNVAHFDLYAMVGYGQMKLLSGSSDTYTAGIGTSVWLNQYFTTRMEVRYLAYDDLVNTPNPRSQNAIQGTFSIGVLL